MLYYQLKPSNTLQEVGDYPQVQTAHRTTELDHPLFSDNLLFKKVTNNEIIFPIAVLHKKAKPTDLLSTVPAGFQQRLLISGRLKYLLAKANTQPLSFFPAKVVWRDNALPDYWHTHVERSDYELVSFPDSEVWLFDALVKGLKVGELAVNDLATFEALLKQYQPPQSPIITHLALKPNAVADYFFLQKIQRSWHFVSQSFRKLMEDSGITGVRFLELNASN